MFSRSADKEDEVAKASDAKAEAEGTANYKKQYSDKPKYNALRLEGLRTIEVCYRGTRQYTEAKKNAMWTIREFKRQWEDGEVPEDDEDSKEELALMYYNIGFNEAAINEWANAQEAFTQATKWNPKRKEFWYWLARSAAQQMGQLENGPEENGPIIIDALTELVKLDPDTENIWDLYYAKMTHAHWDNIDSMREEVHEGVKHQARLAHAGHSTASLPFTLHPFSPYLQPFPLCTLAYC